MQDTLCYTKYDLTKDNPESTIGNFVNLCLNYAQADIHNESGWIKNNI